MADDATGGEVVRGAQFVVYGKDKTQLIFDVWKGSLYIKVSKDRTYPFNRKLSPSALAYLCGELEGIKADPPGSAPRVLTSDIFNFDTKKRERDFAIVLSKDDAQVYSIEFNDAKGASYKAQLLSSNLVTVGTEPMSDAKRSAIWLVALLQWLRGQAQMSMAVTNSKPAKGYGRSEAAPSGKPAGGSTFDDSDSPAF